MENETSRQSRSAGNWKNGMRERKPAIWEIRYEAPRFPDGRRNQKTVTFYGNATAAKRERHRLVNEVKQGRFREPSRETVAGFLRFWLENHAEGRLSPKTCAYYREIVEKHFIPALG